MFGKDRLLEGAPAHALILDKKVYASKQYSGQATTCRYGLRVRFDDGSTEETSIRVWSRELAAGQVGGLLPVRYDPADRSKIVSDEPALTAQTEARQAKLMGETIARGERELDAASEPPPDPGALSSPAKILTGIELPAARVADQRLEHLDGRPRRMWTTTGAAG